MKDDKSLERVRWRCRRGMLELDIVLDRFVARHYAGLSFAGRAAFDALLDMPDTELWDMITGREIAKGGACADSARDEVLKLLRAA